MTQHANIIEWPLHLVGVSDPVAKWLKQAGLPIVQVGQESPLTSAFRWNKKSPNASSSPVRCLLFDSRDLWSRTVAKHPPHPCLCKLDVAKILNQVSDTVKPSETTNIANPIRFAFFEQLKQALEQAGGVWVRLADFPYPYQGMVSVEPTSDVKSKKNQPHGLEEIQARYSAGLPSMVASSEADLLANLPPVSGLQSPGLPLLWRVNQADFSKWWKVRKQMEITVRQSSTQFRVDCSLTSTDFCPVLEIWRGNHLANVPLRSTSMLVCKEGLVFQQQSLRHPAGFTAGWPDSPIPKSSVRLSA